MPQEEAREHLSMVRLMALLATFTTAADVRQGILERRAGNDPSDQIRSDKALAEFKKGVTEIGVVLTSFQASLVKQLSDEGPLLSSYFRDFTHLVQLRRLIRLLKRVHQHMLSIYPAVEENDLEECRRLATEAENMIESQIMQTSLFLAFVERCFTLIHSLESHYP